MNSNDRMAYILALDGSALGVDIPDYNKKQLAIMIMVGHILKNPTEYPEHVVKAARISIPKRITLVRRNSSDETPFELVSRLFTPQHREWGYDDLTANGVGPAQLLRHLKRALDASKPTARMWVECNPVQRIFTLLGRGPTPPQGYSGYIPVSAGTLGDDE